MSKSRRRFPIRGLPRWLPDTRGGAAVEFALVSFPFFILLFGILELSFDLFTEAVLENALHQAARQLQTGNAQNVTNGNAFIQSYLCPAMNGLLDCRALHISVQKISPSSNQDLYDYTTGTLPVTGGTLDLSAYSSGSFCNMEPNTLMLISAIYIGPSILAGLVPGGFSVSYNGSQVHASLATVGVVSEAYPTTVTTSKVAPPC